MVRLLLRTLVFLASAAVGLLAASLLLDQVSLHLSGFLVAVVLFAVAQNVLTPFIATQARRHAPAFLGGIGLVSTFVALLIASFTPGLVIRGVTTWVLATLVVWLVTAIATMVLPAVLLKNQVEKRRNA